MGKNIAIIVLVILLLGSIAYNVRTSDDDNLGSVVTGQEYYATTTDMYGIDSSGLIKSGYGSLAQVTVTGAGTSGFSLYNATSTNFDEIAGKSTSTQLLVTVPASLAAGTYTYDVTYTDGLYIYYDTVGTHVTSTISYR